MLTLSPCTLNVIHRMKSQMSIDERRYEAPTSAPPALAELETTTPDVVPDTGPLYDDLNTLSKKVHNYCFVFPCVLYTLPSHACRVLSCGPIKYCQ